MYDLEPSSSSSSSSSSSLSLSTCRFVLLNNWYADMKSMSFSMLLNNWQFKIGLIQEERTMRENTYKCTHYVLSFKVLHVTYDIVP
jgi:hypothetical protein